MKILKEFSGFVREQGVVGLAVGLAIGASAGDAVKAIVNNFINPLVGVVLQGTDLTGIHTTVTVDGKPQVFGWGVILQSIITLLATAFVVYFLVDKAGLTKVDKKKKKD